MKKPQKLTDKEWWDAQGLALILALGMTLLILAIVFKNVSNPFLNGTFSGETEAAAETASVSDEELAADMAVAPLRNITAETIDTVAAEIPETEPETEELKGIEEIAGEVISGIWGNGQERISALAAAGYDPEAVQEIVDSRMPARKQAAAYSGAAASASEDGWIYINEPNQVNSTYMGVHCITDTGSAQYQWLQSHDWGYTDEGICCYDGRILVALTPAFGSIGDYVDLLLADGSILPVIICDEKANAGTWGHWHEGGLNVIELIVSPDWYSGHENKWYPDVLAFR